MLIKSKTSTGFMLASEAANLSFEEFINHTCVKAGLDKEAWLNPNNKVFKFKEQIFQS
jgi:AMMECR1 domain-containing protein